jgi:hypothetical protein
MGNPVVGGELIKVVEIDTDQCTLVYGNSPCAAVLGTTGDAKCQNTQATCQDTDNYDRGTLTTKHVTNQSSAPRDEYLFPNLIDFSTTPSRLNTSSRSRNEPLGQRAVMRATFIDHPDTDRFVDKYAEERISGAAQADSIGYNPLDRGSFWGKWRARNLYYLGRPIRALQGVVSPVVLTELTTRHYIIESASGGVGGLSLVAKDPLKLADDDRAQAPVASTGELSADISSTTLALTLSPVGIGNLEYPSGTGFLVSIGKEVMIVSARSGDSITVANGGRGAEGTTAETHDAEDTVQLCLSFAGETVATIVNDLLITYAKIDASYITIADWNNEVSSFLPGLYTAVIAKPESVKKLIGELAEQAGFSIWWDEVAQKIRLSAVKQPGVGALNITDDWMIEGSLKIKDRPGARISQVWTNFGILSPTEKLDDDNNYRSTLVTIDAAAGGDDQYGQDAVRKINSRWINQFNKSAALDLNARLLSRFRDMIREVSFKLPSYRADQILMGDSHTLSTQYIQDGTGAIAPMDIRILAVEQDGDIIRVDAEELRFLADQSVGTKTIIVDTDTTGFNLRNAYDTVYAPPVITDDIVCIVESDAVVGSSSSTSIAFYVGDWSAYSYNSITIIVYGRIAGAGGAGGGSTTENNGRAGGTGLYTETAITIENNGTIAGGGGGGGYGIHVFDAFVTGSAGGGGGAGRVSGPGGAKGSSGPEDYDGQSGTLTVGGEGGNQGSGPPLGGYGGAPGAVGNAASGNNALNGTGGAAGYAIDGISHVTLTGNAVTGPTTG